ncbi:MAG TPA: SPOR domain-containing protein [Flavipsychrobacter sp.]|nr:SPOR domain-containing protein [Flavipsychrobacter sp.]
MMKKIYLFLITFFVLGTSFSATAQEKDDATEMDTTTGVSIHADPRLDILLASNVNATLQAKRNYVPKGAKVIRSSKGFRVQIYNGNDKKTAINRKVEFMRRFPAVKTYMTYTQPIFRVKVGDFTTRKEAQAFMSQISGTFSPVMVVPDYIVINTFHK